MKLKSNRGLPEPCGVKTTIRIAKNRKNWFLPEELAFFVVLMNFSGQIHANPPNKCVLNALSSENKRLSLNITVECGVYFDVIERKNGKNR